MAIIGALSDLLLTKYYPEKSMVTPFFATLILIYDGLA
jgi:hypothetical protein